MLQVGSFTCHKLSFTHKLGLSHVTSWVFHVLQVGSFTSSKLGLSHVKLSRDKLGLSPVISCLSHVCTSWVFHLS